MTATVRIPGLTLTRGAQVLLTGLDLTVGPGEVVALVGPNGCGKSSLLDAVAGQLTPESGSIAVTPPTAAVDYFAQVLTPEPAETVQDLLSRITGVGSAHDRFLAASARLATGAAGADDEYEAALTAWLASGGADFDDRAAQALAGLGLPQGPATPVAALSGGQFTRVRLVGLLLSRFDLLLLDEPTNNLDGSGLAELESFIATVPAGCLLVTHDRVLLERTATRVVEFDPVLDSVRDYAGGYTAFLAERTAARQAALTAFAEAEEQRARLRRRIQDSQTTRQRGERHARAAYAKGTVDKLGKQAMLEGATAGGSTAARLARELDRVPDVPAPRRTWELHLTLGEPARAPDVLVTMRDATVEHDGFTLGPVSLAIGRGDRVLITGANGSGKSTLVALLLGERAPDQGERTAGAGIVALHQDQDRSELQVDQPLLDVVRAALPDLTSEQIRTLLAKFGLGADDVLRPARSLSPGEQTRAGLAIAQARQVNLLVLDEPTNHLDLAAVEQLEDALRRFAGTLILVTHDRRLAQALGDDVRRLELDSGSVREV